MQSFEIKLTSTEENYQYWKNYTYTYEFVWVHLMRKLICYVVLNTKLDLLSFKPYAKMSCKNMAWVFWTRRYVPFLYYGNGHETYGSFKPDRCAMCVPGLFRAALQAESYFNFKLIKWLWFFQKWGTWHLRLAQGQITGVVPFRA